VSLAQTGFIPLPSGREPGFDHADTWLGDGGGRIFVAHTGADRVEVIDCEARAFLHSIDDLPGVAGVLIDQEHDLLFTSDRGCARASIFRCSDEQLLGRIEVGQRPNGLAYDRARRRLYAFKLGEPPGVGCTASVIDVDAMSVVAEIALPGRPRWATYDLAGDIVYANIREPAVVLRIDPNTGEIVSAIDVPVPGPHGLWVDEDRLYCAADGGALVVIHQDTGVIAATVPLPGAPDVVWQDPVAHELYVAVGDPGTVTVVDTAALELVESVTTELGAHTLGWDPTHKTLYVFCPGSGGAALFTRRNAGS
jgi:DNA-binding beta-propeller fold protein YncE